MQNCVCVGACSRARACWEHAPSVVGAWLLRQVMLELLAKHWRREMNYSRNAVNRNTAVLTKQLTTRITTHSNQFSTKCDLINYSFTKALSEQGPYWLCFIHFSHCFGDFCQAIRWKVRQDFNNETHAYLNVCSLCYQSIVVLWALGSEFFSYLFVSIDK
jgi:hypothetical protein